MLCSTHLLVRLYEIVSSYNVPKVCVDHLSTKRM